MPYIFMSEEASPKNASENDEVKTEKEVKLKSEKKVIILDLRKFGVYEEFLSRANQKIVCVK